MFTTGLKEFKEVNKKTYSFTNEALLKNERTRVQYIIAILLRSTFVDNKEQARLEKHYGFQQEDITKEIESFLLMEISKAMTESMTNPTAPSERLLYPDLSSVSERLINEKTQANNKFINNINNKKVIRKYYETENNNNNKKLGRYKNYIKIAEITEILLSSIATTATTTSVALTGIGLTYSIPTAFATATVCGSLSKTINTKIRNKIVKFSQIYILSKQFSNKFNGLHSK